MYKTNQHKRIFISKHTVGMCGVGKFMHLWKERDSPSCPRCGQFEDAAHVWVCSGCNSSDIWNNSLKQLDTWMTSVSTDPEIQDTILHYLKEWRNGGTTALEDTPNLISMVQTQFERGWQSFFEGWIPTGWEEAQQAYYAFVNSNRTGRRWTICLILKLWDIAWDLWEHRNGVLHEQNNVLTSSEIRQLNQKVRSIYGQIQQAFLSPHDKYLLNLPLESLISKDYIYKKTWLIQAQAAWAASRLTSRANSSRTMMFNMKRVMRQWLQGGT